MDSRMRKVMEFVREGSFVADIGADHGYLSIELALSGRAAKIIATEKNFYPCEALRRNISLAGLENAIEVRIGDGLQVISVGEVDTICIAGMGGALIKKILDDSPEVVNSARQLILQPMNAAEKVREWLNENNWTIDDEELAEASGFIYEIISAVRFSGEKRTFKRETSPLLKKFLIQRVKKLERVLEEMKNSPSARNSEKFSAIQVEIDDLRRLC